MAETLQFPARHVRLGSNAGQPFTRREGVLKVTGGATFTADNRPDGLLYAVFAASSVARGRVTFLDVDAARAHPGVVEVLTPANRPPLARDPDEKMHMFSWRFEALQSDVVRYAGQPVALVIAETLEAATEGARLLAPRYQAEPVSMTVATGDAFDPPAVERKSAVAHPGETRHGADQSRRREARFPTQTLLRRQRLDRGVDKRRERDRPLRSVLRRRRPLPKHALL